MIKIKNLDQKRNKFLVSFSYQPLTAGKHEIYLSADFNGFSSNQNKFSEQHGIYYCNIKLEKGKYHYKYIVDGNWIPNIEAEEISPDGFGGHNSVLYVGDPDEINSHKLVRVTYPYDANIKSVFIAGSFNNWDPARDRLLKHGDQDFEIILPLNTGKYLYRLIVDGKWICDPNLDETELNSFQEPNSVLIVNENFPSLSENPDNNIITFGLSTTDITKFCQIMPNNKLRTRVISYKDNCSDISMILKDRSILMELIDSNHIFNYFQLDLEIDEFDFDFCFLFRNADKILYLGENGFFPQLNFVNQFHLKEEELTPFLTPDWVKNGIIYQIFTDRFFNGDPSLNQDFSEWYYNGLTSPPAAGEKLPSHIPCYNFVEDWYDHSGLLQSPYHNDGIPDHFSFFGGDLTGIRKKLDYLTDLGITIIYLNPIFEARSNHKYDCSDYKKVDPHFGSQSDFKTLVSECHSNGIRVIIDVAFNHTGDTFQPFTESREHGPDSKFYQWYEWKKWPLPEDNNYIPSEYYSCWWGLGHMPDLDYDKSRLSPEENPVKNIADADPNWVVVNYILEVAEFWLIEMDIDGFRLDVPNEVPFWFWKLFRQKVKSLKPDAYIVGEIWHNAEEWVGNDYFDAVMNYACFKDPVILFFNLRKINAEDFDKSLKPGLMSYPEEAVKAMMNLLDSHDTFRYLEIAQGDIPRLKLALIFQMTYLGTPHIWYGDEIGMMGAHDPDCRRPFNWKYIEDENQVELRDFYKLLIRIRHENNVLVNGNFKTIYAKDMIYAYLRRSKGNDILIILNNDNSDETIDLVIENPGNYCDLLTNKNYLTKGSKLSIKLEKYTGAILAKVN